MSENTNVFLEATRLALRFDGEAQVNLTTEQLWQLPLTTTRTNQSSLDGVGKIIMRELREQGEDSLVAPANNAPKKLLQLKLEVVKAIIDNRQAENSEKAAKLGATSEAARLREILETKKAADLQNLPTEEIEKRLREAEAKARG